MIMKLWLVVLMSLMASAETFAQRQDKRCQPPVMGWSSWNTYRVNINEKLIEKQADALVSKGLKDVGYCYINIDDGFFGGRNADGMIIPNRKRFPNGLRVVSDYIHSLGLKAGIYSEAGCNTCGSMCDNDSLGIGSGLYGHEQQDMNLYLKDWNYDFIKIDYCGAQALGLDEEERYRTISNAIKSTGRNDVSINICRWAFPGTWAKKYARSWRISGDINPSWNSVKDIIEKNLYLSAYAGCGHYNDMDMLEIGRGLKKNEEEVHFGLWCMMSSPLLIGCDMTKIPESSLNLLKNKELIAVNQDVLGLQAYVVQHENDGYVLVKDIISLRGNTRAVALYNPSDRTVHFNVPLASLEFSGKVKARDLVSQKNMGTVKDSIMADVEPHGVRIMRIDGRKRVEPSVYEAEWAYLPCYDDLAEKSPTDFLFAVSRCFGKDESFKDWRQAR